MQIYDYRHELIELLENTSSDQQSLRQTLQSLNTVINILNHYIMRIYNFNNNYHFVIQNIYTYY